MQFLAEKQRFQFYDSPIKRFIKKNIKYLRSLFQFYDSPIKRQSRAIPRITTQRFQFYDSPIKSILSQCNRKEFIVSIL